MIAGEIQSTVDEPKDIVQDIVTARIWNEVERLRIKLRVLATVNLSRQNVSDNHAIFDQSEVSPGLCDYRLADFTPLSTSGVGYGVIFT